MKNVLIILFIIFISSCSNKVELTGDWKINGFIVNDIKSEITPNFSPIFFKTDSLVIYFSQLNRYSVKRDSIFLYDLENDNMTNKMGIEFVDKNNFNLHYTRYLKNPDNDSIKTIPYESQWTKVN